MQMINYRLAKKKRDLSCVDHLFSFRFMLISSCTGVDGFSISNSPFSNFKPIIQDLSTIKVVSLVLQPSCYIDIVRSSPFLVVWLKRLISCICKSKLCVSLPLFRFTQLFLIGDCTSFS